MRYIIILIVAVIFISGFLIYQGIYLPVDSNSEEMIVFSVKKGEGAKEIALNLKNQGLIRYSSFFRAYVLVCDQADKLKAGEYGLSFSMNIPEIADKLTSKDRIKRMITIIEGWNLKDIEKYLKEQGINMEENLTPDLEGYLSPDTYEISPGDGINEIIKIMLDNFEKKITPELKEEIQSQEKTISQIIILASLIEKEVRTTEDKKIVSGILWKRIKVDMPLQVDATITYLTGKKSTEILKEELEINSPYNTYKYKGLPPGPICNPGLNSILAAIYPQESEYWFYLSTPAGETIFSKTLKEHNEAKTKYL